MAGSRDRPEPERAGTFTPLEYGSLYDEGGARGTSGAAGIDSPIAPVVGGRIILLFRRLWLVAVDEAATGRAVLLGMVVDMAGTDWNGSAGWASVGRRYEVRLEAEASGAWWRVAWTGGEAYGAALLLSSMLRRAHGAGGVAEAGGGVMAALSSTGGTAGGEKLWMQAALRHGPLDKRLNGCYHLGERPMTIACGGAGAGTGAGWRSGCAKKVGARREAR